MKQKLFLFTIVFTVLLITGCSGDKNYYIDENVREQLDKFTLTRSVEVPVQEGKVTVGYLNGVEIFRGTFPASIQVPKFNLTDTRNGTDVEWHFVQPTTGNNDKSWYFGSLRAGILIFEDVPNGDNDYNDFVCYVKEKFEYNLNGNGYIRAEEGLGLELSNLEFYPIAMGNILPMSFGIEIVNLKDNSYIDDYSVFEDVRKECFKNHPGFINTDPAVAPYPMYNWSWSISRDGKGVMRYYPLETRYDQVAVNYYIKVDGVKYYTADSSKALLTNNKTPYGLFIPNVTTFRYPIEQCPIWDAYPNFKSWVGGKNVNPFANPNSSLLYN